MAPKPSPAAPPSPATSSAPLVNVGSVAYDTVETRHGRREDILGGSCTYFSVAAALLAPPSSVAVVAVVGEDFRDEDVALLESRGVDTEGLQRAVGRTFRWSGRYHKDMNGRDTLSTELNVFEHFNPVIPPQYQNARQLFLGNIHPSLQETVLDRVPNAGFVALDTMNLWIDTARDDLLRVLGRVDALFVNDEEGRQLTGEYGMPSVARALMAMGPRVVVLKRGEHGALVFTEGGVFSCPAIPLDEVVDPTGAGDSFAGGFMGYLARSGDYSAANLRRAAIAGTLVASFNVQGFSLDRLRTVTGEQLERRYERFVDLTTAGPLQL